MSTAAPLRERLLSRMERDDAGCWIWRGLAVRRWVHRVSYETFVGPIPDGMTVDHLCFVPLCINPAHLRLLTREENSRRQRKAWKTHCIHGHPLDGANLLPSSLRKGHRGCRACSQARARIRHRGSGDLQVESDAALARILTGVGR